MLDAHDRLHHVWAGEKTFVASSLRLSRIPHGTGGIAGGPTTKAQLIWTGEHILSAFPTHMLVRSKEPGLQWLRNHRLRFSMLFSWSTS